MPGTPGIIEDLTEEEKYLWAIISDQSGLDLAEFCWLDEMAINDLPNGNGEIGQPDSPSSFCWRAWPYQWPWFRSTDPQQIDQCARSVGKSLSIKLRGFAFPFVNPGAEMVITAPELNHLEPITDLIENQFYSCRLGRVMLQSGRSGVTHRPFKMNFKNNARIMGRIPQKDGKGVKGCVVEGTPILTRDGWVFAEDLRRGDLVLTHEGRWRAVAAIFEDVNDCYRVTGIGSFPMEVSCDHRFYVSENKAGPKHKRELSDLFFMDVEDLIDCNAYWASPTQIPSERLVLPKEANGKDFWWLVGRWLADGHVSMDKKNNKSRRVHWTVHADKAHLIEEALTRYGKRFRRSSRDHSSADEITTASAWLYEWLRNNFGEHADGKRLPAWSYMLSEEDRKALLDGYLSGDGHWNKDKQRWEAGTASKLLAVSLQILAQTLGFHVTCSVMQPKTIHICGKQLKNKPKLCWRIYISESGKAGRVDGYLVGKIKKVEPVGKKKIFDIKVEEDHSYLAGSIMSHNIHPIWLEMDEAQDYPEPGWKELFETVKQGFAGVPPVWRAHGVTRGVRDKFYEYTTKGAADGEWKVHRYTAMHRPVWTDDERQKKIALYHGRDDPDYRRNVLGEHGDATSPIFVLHRLMACTDDDAESDYNTDEYTHFEITDSWLEQAQTTIEQELDLPTYHLSKYAHRDGGRATFWAGMDVGWTNHPSEIVVFAEELMPKDEYDYYKKNAPMGRRKSVPPLPTLPRLKLVCRITLTRIGAPDQKAAIMKVIEHYRPKAFSFDATGAGLPMFQDIQAELESPEWSFIKTVVKGYNFSGNILVDFDQTIDVDEFATKDEVIKETGIKRNTVEYATDKLRYLIDNGRFWLPWDKDLLGEFEGQTYKVTKTALNQYGKREYSLGKFHALDACRMMALGWAQYAIEEFVKRDDQKPVIDVFMGV